MYGKKDTQVKKSGRPVADMGQSPAWPLFKSAISVKLLVLTCNGNAVIALPTTNSLQSDINCPIDILGDVRL